MSEERNALVIESRQVGVRPHALVRRLSRGTFALMMAAFVASLVMSWMYPGSEMAPTWFNVALGLSFITAMGTALAALLAQIVCWIGPTSGGRLTVDVSGVQIHGGRSRFVPRADVETGWTLHEAVGPRVELQLRNGDVLSATTATPEEANGVLDAAGIDPARRALRMPLGGASASVGIGFGAALPASCIASMVAVGAQGLLHLPSAATGFLIFALFTGLVGAAVRLFAPPVVSVGSDGLSVRGARSSWFVAFEEIVGVSYGRGDLTLHLRDGRPRRISTFGTSEPRRAALYNRLTAGVNAARAPADLSVRLTALDRGGQSAEAWRAALRELAAQGNDYRHTGLSRDEVRAALEEPRATPERRIGAAFVLSLMDPAEAGTRVRIASEAVAHEPVRIALERAAEGELDEQSLEAANEGRVGVGSA